MSLPAPVSSQAAPTWARPRRLRVLFALVAVLVIYALLPSETLGGRPWGPPPWRGRGGQDIGPADVEAVAPPFAEPDDASPAITLDPQVIDDLLADVQPVDEGPPAPPEDDDTDYAAPSDELPLANPKGLPIRLPAPYPAHPHPPRDALGNPWPHRPEIAGQWLARDRAHVDPPEPEWPDSGIRIPTHPLSHDHMIAFKDLPIPAGYVAPPRPGKKRSLPQVQFDFARHGVETDEQKRVRHARREWVRRAMIHVWEGYKAVAWGHDETAPVSGTSRDGFNGWGATLVDALDTLLIMGLEREYNLARTHARALDFTLLMGTGSGYGAADGVSIPTFETCIRYLGGFVAAYDLSGDALMLERGRELGDWMMGAFGTKQGLPMSRYQLGLNLRGQSSGRSVLAEVGTMSLEFGRLWQLTGNTDYWDVVQRVVDFLDTGLESSETNNDRVGTLLPTSFYADAPKQLAGSYSFGGEADSVYEYYIKTYQLLGGAAEQPGRMYGEAIDSAMNTLIQDVRVVPGHENEFVTIGQYSWGTFQPVLEHLACFAGGMLALGSRLLGRTSDLETGLKFAETCFWAYDSSASGVGPESLTFYGNDDEYQFQELTDDTDGSHYLVPRGNPPGVRMQRAGYRGRPETTESLFYAYRITGDVKWQDKAWQMFTALVENCATEHGLAALYNVDTPAPAQDDVQESFVLAETLKYMYLVFDDPTSFSLDEWVFSTEAHPFRLTDAPSKSPYWSGPDADIDSRYLQPTRDGSLPPVGAGTADQLLHRIHRAEEEARVKAIPKPKPGVAALAAKLGGGGRGAARPFGGQGLGRPGGGIVNRPV